MERIIFIASLFVYPMFFIYDLLLGEILTIEKYRDLGALPKLYAVSIVLAAFWELLDCLARLLFLISLI